jgi:hypothetical protein
MAQKTWGPASGDLGQVVRPRDDVAASATPTARPDTPCRGDCGRSTPHTFVVQAPGVPGFWPGIHHAQLAASGPL